MRRIWLMAAPVVLLLLSCADGPVEPARHGWLQAGTQSYAGEYFAFLSPLERSGNTAGADFNPDLATVVEVCRLASSTQCGDLLVRFGPSATGTADTGIIVDAVAEHYQVNWQLSKHVAVAGTYRISVLTGASDLEGVRTFGFIDVLIDADGATVVDPATGLVMKTYNPKQSIPVKYRLEKGALCVLLKAEADCLEQSVGAAGGTFVLAVQAAGASFPAGAIPDGFGAVNLIVERVTTSNGLVDCLPTTFPQYTGCYAYRTEPRVDYFAEPVVIGICPDPAAMPLERELELWKWDGVDPATLLAIPRRDVDFLDCPGWTGPDGSPSSAATQAAGARPRGPGLTAPRADAGLDGPDAMERISPFGGGLNDFSRMGWVRPLEISIVSGDGESAVVGSAVVPAPVVRVRATGERVVGLVPVAGVPVTFTPSGTSTAAPATVITDAAGLAATEWTLGSTTGAYTLVAAASNPLTSWPNIPGAWGSVTFGATALDPGALYSVSFLSPVKKGAGSGSTIGGLDVAVEVCRVTGSNCAAVASFTLADMKLKDRFYQVAWSSPSTLQQGDYRIRVLVNGLEAGTMQLQADRKATSGSTEPYSFKPGQNVEIKFSLATR
jgi:hypothetical protein